MKKESKISEWISVDDRLPESSFSWYLICSEKFQPKVTMAFFESLPDDSCVWLCHNDSDDGDEWSNVTHWMPLPEPPNKWLVM